MPITIVVGEQRGDEGKGRIVDMLAADADIVARFNGGPNAGHTVVLPNGDELGLHLIPSGIAYSGTINVIGNGTLIDPVKLCAEIDAVIAKGMSVSPKNLKISNAAHLILPHHIASDEVRESGTSKQGSTKSGIAQAAADKYARTGLQLGTIINDPEGLQNSVTEGLARVNKDRQAVGLVAVDVQSASRQFMDSAKRLSSYLADTAAYLNTELRSGKRVLAEGAQAFLLDIDQGMYPYVTSTNTTTGGVLTGLGVGPQYVERVIGAVKATQSHVGGGPFPTEITDPALLERLRGTQGEVDAEYGTTTGRARRIGHLDLPQLRRAQMINGSQEIGLTKLDCLPRYGDTVLICTKYKRNGQELEIAPASARELEACEPVYTELSTWREDIRDIRDFDKLPKNAQQYVAYIEEQTGLPVTMIGVGPRRDQIIRR